MSEQFPKEIEQRMFCGKSLGFEMEIRSKAF